jgi:hypothetical protein
MNQKQWLRLHDQSSVNIVVVLNGNEL